MFGTALQATVKDAANNPVNGATVTFTTPSVATGFTHVTGQSAGGSATSGKTVAVTLANNPTAGNVVALAILYYSGGASGTTISSIKDANNNSYTVTANSPSVYDSGAGQIFLAYRLPAPANASKTITVTFVGTIVTAAVWADEFAASGGTATFDSDIRGTGTGTGINTPTISVSGASELLYSGVAYQNTVTAAKSPWVQNTKGPIFGNDAAYLLGVSGSTAISYTGDTASALWTSMGMSFRVTPIATATFGGLATATAVTNGSGIATAPALTANTQAGLYTVTASAPGIATPAIFNLTNTAGTPASVTATAGISQSATISTTFATSLQATVKDASFNPVGGVAVTFAAPGAGASGVFGGSATSRD